MSPSSDACSTSSSTYARPAAAAHSAGNNSSSSSSNAGGGDGYHRSNSSGSSTRPVAATRERKSYAVAAGRSAPMRSLSPAHPSAVVSLLLYRREKLWIFCGWVISKKPFFFLNFDDKVHNNSSSTTPSTSLSIKMSMCWLTGWYIDKRNLFLWDQKRHRTLRSHQHCQLCPPSQKVVLCVFYQFFFASIIIFID